MKRRPLTARERAFISAYRGKARGNATQAARLAGYTGPASTLKVTASRLLTKANVRQAVEERVAQEEAKGRAEALERDLVLSAILRDGQEETLDRIQAIKELNKVDGRHVFKLQLDGKLTLVEALGLSRQPEAADE